MYTLDNLTDIGCRRFGRSKRETEGQELNTYTELDNEQRKFWHLKVTIIHWRASNVSGDTSNISGRIETFQKVTLMNSQRTPWGILECWVNVLPYDPRGNKRWEDFHPNNVIHSTTLNTFPLGWGFYCRHSFLIRNIKNEFFFSSEIWELEL